MINLRALVAKGHKNTNAPLILNIGILFFFWFWANCIMGHFKGYYEGAKTFLTPKLSRAQRCIGIFVSLLTDNLVNVSLLLFEIQFFEIRLFLHTERNVF